MSRDFVMARAGAALAMTDSLRESLTSFLQTMAAPPDDEDDRAELLSDALDEAHLVATAIGHAQEAFAELSDDELATDEDSLLPDDEDEGDEGDEGDPE